jgi:hypothetical protein
MTELAELERVRALFTGEHLRFVLDAMIAGNSPARAWADGRAALIWDGSYSIYLAGNWNGRWRGESCSNGK